MIKFRTAAALAALLFATPLAAEPVAYDFDKSHTNLAFSYNHLGYSTTYGMFAGFEGEIMFDEEDPANSSVSVAMPVRSSGLTRRANTRSWRPPPSTLPGSLTEPVSTTQGMLVCDAVKRSNTVCQNRMLWQH